MRAMSVTRSAPAEMSVEDDTRVSARWRIPDFEDAWSTQVPTVARQCARLGVCSRLRVSKRDARA